MAKGAPQKQRILLIENNINHAELIENTLRPHFPNLTIDVATTYLSGIEKSRGRKYDLILTDFFLPHFTGIETIEKIRRTSKGAPLIVITGKGDDRTASLAVKAGATDYLVKSKETLAELPQIIGKALGENHRETPKQWTTAAWSPPNIPGRILSEVNHMTLKVRELSNMVTRASTVAEKPTPATTRDISLLLTQINRLKTLASKLVR